MGQISKCFVLFLIMGSIYYYLEILYDGSSHYSMFIVAGVCGVFGDLINEIKPDMKVIKQCFLITSLILFLEYITGYFLNIRMGLNIWDYSSLPLNLNGQICLSFGLIWFFLFSPLIIWLGDAVRHFLWNEEAGNTLFNIYKEVFTEIADQIVGIGQQT